jgi:mRNA-degrading endonuclease RelE of RelBE toxin-antitoxin system
MNGGVEILRTSRFTKELNNLDGTLRDRVHKTIANLKAVPTPRGLNREKIDGRWTCRVSRAVRILYEMVPGVSITLVAVGQHDYVYRQNRLYFVTTLGQEEDIPESESQEVTVFNMGFTMDNLWQELTGALGDTQANDLVGHLMEIIPMALANDTEGKAKPITYGPGGVINMIPADEEGPCTPLLLGLCFDNDNFDNRMREVAYHAGILCPDTAAVVVVTSQWRPRDWKRHHADAFANLNAAVLVYFAGFGKLTRIA